MSSRFSIDPLVDQYRRYRSAGKKLNQKIINTLMSEAVFDTAVQALELGENKRLVLDTQDDLDVAMDYGLYEVPQAGRNLIEQYALQAGGANRAERDLLPAMVNARTGLFRVERTLAPRHQLILQELTEEQRQLTVIDLGLSQSPIETYVLFLRPIVFAQFAMTSGVGFVFPPKAESALTARWTRWLPTERFAKYFKLYKNKGIPISYE